MTPEQRQGDTVDVLWTEDVERGFAGDGAPEVLERLLDGLGRSRRRHAALRSKRGGDRRWRRRRLALA
eukprot:12349084-Alexandrium_andersonii.AAC.1